MYQILQEQNRFFVYTLHHIYAKKKFSYKMSFQLGMDLKEVQKQGRDERTPEDYIPDICLTKQQMYR